MAFESENIKRSTTSLESRSSSGVGIAMPYNSDFIDTEKHRYPHSIVWTPIPCLTWFLPFIGHMGICYSNGVIRDFAGPYYVSEDNMGFGNPVKYWQMSLDGVPGINPQEIWDRGVHDASEEYKGRMHNLICDNCHSHCAYALNTMRYKGSTSWNMVKLCFLMMCHSRYVSTSAFLKTWVPFFFMMLIILTIVLVSHFV